MVSTHEIPAATVQTPAGEKRVALHNISWASYEKILDALGNQRSAQLSYYKGILEIMSPLEEHESFSSRIDQFINVLTEEANITLKSLQSTTLSKPGLKVGSEPDQCYYIANEFRVRGKIVDLKIDPPPDLIVEVDITHTDIDKNALYAEMGVPEFWRYNGEILTIYQLQAGQYQAVEKSPTFPVIPIAKLYEFLKECAQQGETQAKRNLRVWVREQLS
jgi:Uma2 family endonuclease